MNIKFVYEIDMPVGSVSEWNVKEDDTLLERIERLMRNGVPGKVVLLELVDGRRVLQNIDHVVFVVLGDGEKITA